MEYLGIDKYQSEKTANELNKLLATYNVYYQNLRNFHWNVEGENFFDLHYKFEDLYSDAREKIDAIAERILTLRHRPMSTMSVYLDESLVDEAGVVEDDREMVKILLENHKQIIQSMRRVMELADDTNDEGTIDMIGGFLSEIEKKSWMLDAWYAKETKMVTA